jgi:putative hemolysin
MSSIALESVVIILLILANGIFAMSEAALISARKVRLQQRANEGDAKARAALELANAPHNFLATVQIGITLIGILAGAFGGATIAEQLAAAFNTIPFIAPYGEALGLGLVVLVITYLSLVIGELVPKNVALNNPENIVSRVARPMSLLSKALSPAVAILSASTNLVLKLIGIKPSDEPPVTEEEIKVMIDQGIALGTFHETERDMVGRVFRLADLRVGALMTPRMEIVWLDANDTPDLIRDKLLASKHSRFPVGQGSLDSVLGIVRSSDLLGQVLAGTPINLLANIQPALFVPETTLAFKVLEMFKQTGKHIALVIDEYGGVQGLVTLTNVMEDIVGDVAMSEETTSAQAVQRDDGSWLIDGLLPLHRLNDILAVKDMAEGESGLQTLGGLVMAQIGDIPQPGNHFEAYGLRFEVMDMDGYRVDKVLVTPIIATESMPPTSA